MFQPNICQPCQCFNHAQRCVFGNSYISIQIKKYILHNTNCKLASIADVPDVYNIVDKLY